MKRSGNPSTPGPGLRTIVRQEQARKAAAAKRAAVEANRKAMAQMRKGI